MVFLRAQENESLELFYGGIPYCRSDKEIPSFSGYFLVKNLSSPDE
jgi:hypothetical protein